MDAQRRPSLMHKQANFEEIKETPESDHQDTEMKVLSKNTE